MHGGAPRIRQERNSDENKPEIRINTGLLIDKTVDAAISAGVSYMVTKALTG